MGTKFTYALILTISQTVFTLLMYFLGFQTDKMATGQYLAQWGPLVISIIVLWFGIRAVREAKPDHSLTYGQGLGAGLLICLYSSLMSAVYNFIHFKFINPSFFEYQLQFMKEKWAAKGMSDTQIEQASGFMQKFSGPGILAIATPIFAMFFGLLVCLVLAAILKRQPSSNPTPPPIS